MKMIEIIRPRSSIGNQPAENDEIAGIKGPCKNPIKTWEKINPPASPMMIYIGNNFINSREKVNQFYSQQDFSLTVRDW